MAEAMIFSHEKCKTLGENKFKIEATNYKHIRIPEAVSQ